jgi:hypothetical protein
MGLGYYRLWSVTPALPFSNQKQYKKLVLIYSLFSNVRGGPNNTAKATKHSDTKRDLKLAENRKVTAVPASFTSTKVDQSYSFLH